MANKIPKKGDHEPTKYFEGEGKLSNSEKLTEQKITTPEEFSEYDIENLCSKYLMNIIYYKMAKKRKREAALNIAANIVLKKGQEIQAQLGANDLAISKGQDKSQSPNPKGGKADIPKISGGTLSEVISKMTEMLAGKSGAEFKKGANNLGAMIEVLASPEVEKKFADVIQHLAKDLVLVATIKDILKDTKALPIFDQAILNNLNVDQQKAVSQINEGEVISRQQDNILTSAQIKIDNQQSR